MKIVQGLIVKKATLIFTLLIFISKLTKYRLLIQTFSATCFCLSLINNAVSLKKCSSVKGLVKLPLLDFRLKNV